MISNKSFGPPFSGLVILKIYDFEAVADIPLPQSDAGFIWIHDLPAHAGISEQLLAVPLLHAYFPSDATQPITIVVAGLLHKDLGCILVHFPLHRLFILEHVALALESQS